MDKRIRDKAEILRENADRFATWLKLIPDSRMRRSVGQVSSPIGLITRIYCLNCGKNCGGVYGEPAFTHVLCDACRDRLGGLPGMEEVKFEPDVQPKEEG